MFKNLSHYYSVIVHEMWNANESTKTYAINDNINDDNIKHSDRNSKLRKWNDNENKDDNCIRNNKFKSVSRRTKKWKKLSQKHNTVHINK